MLVLISQVGTNQLNLIEVFFQPVTQAHLTKDNLGSPTRSQTYDLLIASSDALPLNYRRLLGAKAIEHGTNILHIAWI